jgi:RNA polymerase sigma factor (sigma-70 family)
MRQTGRMEYKGDTYYIDEVLNGKQNAFTWLVNRHKDHAYNLAIKICGNHEEAEEIAQDAFIKAYRSLGQFKMKSSFATWLYRIVYNTAISLVRTRKKAPLSLEDFPADAADFIGISSSEEEAEAEYRSSLLNFALQKISAEERGLIGLYYYDELTTDEIAGITGTGKSNIKVKLFRARQKMIEIIEKVEKKNLTYHE